MKILSFLITILFAAAISTQAREPVLDTDGNPLLAAGQFSAAQYYIMPVNNKGGLTATTVISPELPFCPLRITYGPEPLPVSFFLPINPRGNSVRTKDTVFIYFRSDYWPFCHRFSKLFGVDEYSTDKEPALLVGGCMGERNSMFKIEREGGANTYKLTTFAGPVGTITNEFIQPILVVTNDTSKTLLVKFQKVDEAITTTATTTSRVDKLARTMFPSY